tara:strand:- start:13052 stop:13414 length:363 start_codon:yes stop_codon:yes gene_type:complete
MNKKGLKHFTDLIMTVVIGFFMILFIGITLNLAVSDSHQSSLGLVEAYDYLTGGISNVLYQSNTQTIPLKINTNEAIRNSKIINNELVTTCFDITLEQDCNKYKPNNKECIWKDNICQIK